MQGLRIHSTGRNSQAEVSAKEDRCGSRFPQEPLERCAWAWGNPASSLSGNLEKSCDHPASDVICLATGFYHIGHILCLQVYEIEVPIEE